MKAGVIYGDGFRFIMLSQKLVCLLVVPVAMVLYGISRFVYVYINW